MEWWHIGPLVLAVIVFLLAGTVIEQHLETAARRIVNRQPQSQATVGMVTSSEHNRDLQQQKEEYLEQQKLRQKQELEKKQEEQQQQQKQDLQREQEMKQQQMEVLHHRQQLLRNQMELQKKLLLQQYTEVLPEDDKNSLPNSCAKHQQPTLRPAVASSHHQQELVNSSHNQQDSQQHPLQSHEQSSEQHPTMQEQLRQRQQSLQVHHQMQRQNQVQELLNQHLPQHQLSDMEPPLPFLAVSEKSILLPTSKTTVTSKGLDFQTKPSS